MENTHNIDMKYSLANFQLNNSSNSSNFDFEASLSNRKLVLNKSRNVFQDILQTLEQRRLNSAEESKDNQGIILCRYSGFDEKTSYLKSIGDLHNKLLELNNLYIYFNDSIPMKIDDNIMNKVTSLLEKVTGAIQNINPKDIFNNKGLFEFTGNGVINSALEEAFYTVLKEYVVSEPGVNESKVKNFVIKILSWAKEYVPDMFKDKITSYNPKILYYGSIKKHECYFLIMMFLTGCDILSLEPSGELEWRRVDLLNKYSYTIEGKLKERITESPLASPRVVTRTQTVVPVSDPAPASAKVSFKEPLQINRTMAGGPTAGISLKRTIDIFSDIRDNIQKRGGYVDGDKPLIPVYFCRYIGMEESEFSGEEFYNKIYILDKELEGGPCNYLRFDKPVPAPQNDELNGILNVLESIFKSKRTVDKDFILGEIYKNKLLPETKNLCMNNTFKYALMETLTLYLSNEELNLSKAKNFLAKLLVWINRYSKELFKDLKSDRFYDNNPKIMYYGEIKHAEIYMLNYFSRTGCDILYINSNHQGDEPFSLVDREEVFSCLQKNPISMEMDSFPEEEKVIRKSTVAYEASNEIQEMLFTPDSGLYKPWQFQEFKTLPVTLKTTFEEVGILWEEDAKIRPNFKIANNTVYVPNIFAKINGTHEDLKQYWSFVSKLRGARYTHFVSGLPFSNIEYTREEMFSLAYILDRDGMVDKEKLVKNKLYKYAYLKSSLQTFIIGKINELLKCDYFLEALDSKFKLKMLITALNIPEDILRLIQDFDFPQAIPKLVIYVNDRGDFSEEDTIILVLLNLIGVDIVILTPTNYNNIENKIKNNIFDTHQLADFHLDLQLNLQLKLKEQKSIFSKIFKLS